MWFHALQTDLDLELVSEELSQVDTESPFWNSSVLLLWDRHIRQQEIDTLE